jgi:mannose-6-phosphate isomerase
VEATAVPLDRLIADSPSNILGAATAAKYSGRLPYLLKVLDARDMLSIQAHPNRLQAEEGFARENAAGIDLRAPQRNYKDANHKPEVHVALTDFWMLHGFRAIEEIRRTVRIVDGVEGGCIRELYGAIMTMPQKRVDEILGPLIAQLETEPPRDKDDPDFWALRAAGTFPLPNGHFDRGIFSIYLLNLLHLRPGQGTFQPAGVLHAYLEGVNVELMANSDNVLRGGLTPKHVDVPELMVTLAFESGPPRVLEGVRLSATETVYHTTAEEFELSCIDADAGKPHTGAAANGPDSLIVLSGAATVRSGQLAFTLRRGDVILVPHAVEYVIEAIDGRARLFKAAVPSR